MLNRSSSLYSVSKRKERDAFMEVREKLELQKMALHIRKGIIEETFNAKSGHPGGSLSATDMLNYLYFKVLKVDPKNPKDEDRDRFVLSKGHSAPALYSVLAHRGFFPVEDLKTLRKADSYLQGHPNMNYVPGVDMSTGSLGQGISCAVGMALSAKMSGKSNRVFAMLGDGELQEGQVWEAAMFAGFNKLDNFVAVVDNNNLQIDGPISEVCSPYPITDKFAAFGWEVIELDDGHDYDKIAVAVEKALAVTGKPAVIVMKTIKGCGVSFMENQCSWHGTAPNKEQYDTAMKELDEKLSQLEVEE